MIKAGDLVMVVSHPCKCSHDPQAGFIGIVEIPSNPGWTCIYCTNSNLSEFVWKLLLADKKVFCRPTWCLKKIPPLGELEGQTSQEKLCQPEKQPI